MVPRDSCGQGMSCKQGIHGLHRPRCNTPIRRTMWLTTAPHLSPPDLSCRPTRISGQKPPYGIPNAVGWAPGRRSPKGARSVICVIGALKRLEFCDIITSDGVGGPDSTKGITCGRSTRRQLLYNAHGYGDHQGLEALPGPSPRVSVDPKARPETCFLAQGRRPPWPAHSRPRLGLGQRS